MILQENKASNIFFFFVNMSDYKYYKILRIYMVIVALVQDNPEKEGNKTGRFFYCFNILIKSGTIDSTTFKPFPVAATESLLKSMNPDSKYGPKLLRLKTASKLLLRAKVSHLGFWTPTTVRKPVMRYSLRTSNSLWGTTLAAPIPFSSTFWSHCGGEAALILSSLSTSPSPQPFPATVPGTTLECAPGPMPMYWPARQ